MQGMHAIGDGGGGGGTAAFVGIGDRRRRPLNHPSQQAVKCPRCDSLNTKFCYYNNYNLSQPRYFCKCCRRYWTKGGVLRNVPVGGGCRKTKRSKAKSSGSDAPRKSEVNAQSSSSESSSLAAAATAPSSALAEDGPAPTNATTSNSTVLFNFPYEGFSNVNPQSKHDADHKALVNHPSTDGQIFPNEMETFTSLISCSEEMMEFSMVSFPTTPYKGDHPVNQAPVAEVNAPTATTADEFEMEDISNDGLATALDWGNGSGDQGLFDLTTGVDPAAYWNQSDWSDNDRTL